MLTGPRTFLTVIIPAVTLFLAACGGSGGVVSSPYPFPAGTAWTYRHTLGSQQGTATVAYDGQHSYRSMSLHRSQIRTTLQPSVVDFTYFEWTGCPATRAIVEVQPTVQIELVLDRALPLLCGAMSLSGSAQVYVNGSFQGNVGWSASSSDGGQWVVTVPSGTYTTRRWNTSLTLGSLMDLAANYVGSHSVLVRADGQSSAGTYRLEHLSGPVSSLSVARAELQAWGMLLLSPGTMRPHHER